MAKLVLLGESVVVAPCLLKRLPAVFSVCDDCRGYLGTEKRFSQYDVCKAITISFPARSGSFHRLPSFPKETPS